MGKARSIARKKKHDVLNVIKICGKGGESGWSDLNHDVLNIVMMRLGVVDFAAFAGVCKSWRSFAFLNMNKFIVSRPPMPISFSPGARKCYLEDIEGRKLSTILPHSAGRTCIGVTCGYLILACRESHDFWLVNLITRHELHFPDVPSDVFCHSRSKDLRGILVFSPSISGWIFVVLSIWDDEIWFSIAGKREWIKVFHRYSMIWGLHAFNGKIFTLHTDTLEHEWFDPSFPSVKVRPCELRLYPDPKLVLLEAETFPELAFTIPRFVSSGENLYVIDLASATTSGFPLLGLSEISKFRRRLCGHQPDKGTKQIFLFVCNQDIVFVCTWTRQRNKNR